MARAVLALFRLGSIERIEVLKGAASALYGADAMSGVINVITKTPSKEGGLCYYWGRQYG